MPDLAELPASLLELLLDNQREGMPMSAGALAQRLGRTRDGVLGDLERLKQAGAVEPASEAVLTAEGVALATSAIRRHALVERLLQDVLRVPWSRVHHEAERWDGVISDEVEQRLVELLDDPGTCPHGNPIPGSRNVPDQTDAVRLADVDSGPAEVVRITEALEHDDEALAVLDRAGIVPGRDIEVRGQGDDGHVEVAGANADTAIAPEVAAQIYVNPR